MEINKELKKYFTDHPSELVNLIYENRDHPGLEHLYYYENDEDFYDTYYSNNNSDKNMVELVLSQIDSNSFNYNDEYIKLNEYGELKTLPAFKYEKLLLENLKYIMEYIDISELSENAQLAAKKDHVMWCPECKDLIESIVYYEKCISKLTLSLEYGYDDDEAALYNNEDEEITEKEENLSMHCEKCNQELNNSQYDYMNSLIKKNDIFL